MLGVLGEKCTRQSLLSRQTWSHLGRAHILSRVISFLRRTLAVVILSSLVSLYTFFSTVVAMNPEFETEITSQ